MPSTRPPQRATQPLPPWTTRVLTVVIAAVLTDGTVESSDAAF